MPLPAVYAVRRKGRVPSPMISSRISWGNGRRQGRRSPWCARLHETGYPQNRERGSSVMKFVCPVCGYVFDEAQEKAAFSSLPETWQCPICKAAKSLFTPQEGEAPAISGEPAQAEELRPLTPGELAAVFSNLARGVRETVSPRRRGPFPGAGGRTLPVWRLKSRTLL